jgi:hypothetical protein
MEDRVHGAVVVLIHTMVNMAGGLIKIVPFMASVGASSAGFNEPAEDAAASIHTMVEAGRTK